MKTPNLKVWTDMLRSGQYQQTRATLATVDENNTTGYCCLGVGCIPAKVGDALLYGGDAEPGLDLPPDGFHVWVGSISEEDVVVLKANRRHHPLFEEGMDLSVDWDGLHMPKGYAPLSHITCAGLNDDLNLTFAQIADVLDYFGFKPLEVET